MRRGSVKTEMLKAERLKGRPRRRRHAVYYTVNCVLLLGVITRRLQVMDIHREVLAHG